MDESSAREPGISVAGQESGSKLRFWRNSVKESRGQPKSGALKQATCKGNF